MRTKSIQPYLKSKSVHRSGGIGGAGGAIAPPTFGSLHSKQHLAPPTFLVGSVNSSTTNFLYLPPPLYNIENSLSNLVYQISYH